MTTYEVFGHTAMWVLSMLGIQDAEGAQVDSAPPEVLPSTAVAVLSQLVAGNLRAAALVRQGEEEAAPPAVSTAPAQAGEMFRASAAAVLTAFSECSALNQVVAVDGQTMDGEAWFAEVATRQLRAATTLADLLGVDDSRAADLRTSLPSPRPA